MVNIVRSQYVRSGPPQCCGDSVRMEWPTMLLTVSQTMNCCNYTSIYLAQRGAKISSPTNACEWVCKYVDRESSTSNLTHICSQQVSHQRVPWLWNPRHHRKVQISGISCPTKRACVLHELQKDRKLDASLAKLGNVVLWKTININVLIFLSKLDWSNYIWKVLLNNERKEQKCVTFSKQGLKLLNYLDAK